MEEKEPTTWEELIAKYNEYRSYHEAIYPIFRNGVYLCGRCYKRIKEKYSYCKWCGQRQKTE